MLREHENSMWEIKLMNELEGKIIKIGADMGTMEELLMVEIGKFLYELLNG